MAINVSVQYNVGFLPDVILLTLRYYHRGTRLNAKKSICPYSLCSHLTKRFDDFSPSLGGYSEGFDVFTTNPPRIKYNCLQNNTNKCNYSIITHFLANYYYYCHHSFLARCIDYRTDHPISYLETLKPIPSNVATAVDGCRNAVVRCLP